MQSALIMKKFANCLSTFRVKCQRGDTRRKCWSFIKYSSWTLESAAILQFELGKKKCLALTIFVISS